MDVTNWLVLAAALIWVVVAVLFYGKNRPDHHFDWVRFISRVAIFGAISTILYIVPVFQIQVPFAPEFLKLHFDEIPAFIAGYAYGPWTAFGGPFHQIRHQTSDDVDPWRRRALRFPLFERLHHSGGLDL
jgi:hypothetical protein